LANEVYPDGLGSDIRVFFIPLDSHEAGFQLILFQMLSDLHRQEISKSYGQLLEKGGKIFNSEEILRMKRPLGYS